MRAVIRQPKICVCETHVVYGLCLHQPKRWAPVVMIATVDEGEAYTPQPSAKLKYEKADKEYREPTGGQLCFHAVWILQLDDILSILIVHQLVCLVRKLR